MKLSIMSFYHFIMIMPLMILWMMIFWMKITPMIMIINLLFFSLFMALNLNVYSHQSLYSFLMFLMMTGGILVIFTFFLSLISNEYWMFNPFFFTYMFIMILLSMYLYIYIKNKFKFIFNSFNLNNYNMEMQSNLFINYNINSIYNFPFNLILLFLMFYLILNLLFITKICLMNNKPLRSNFN